MRNAKNLEELLNAPLSNKYHICLFDREITGLLSISQGNKGQSQQNQGNDQHAITKEG